MIDPIVEEIHKIREEQAAKFDFDVDVIFNDLRQKQSTSDRKIVSFAENKEKNQVSTEKKVA